ERAGQLVDVLGEVAPGAGDAADLGLAAELALRTDLAGDAGDFVGERGELVDHGVHSGLEFEDLALRVDGDLLGQITARHRGGYLSDVAHLSGQVGAHRVDVVGQVAPGARDTGDLGLAAELALGTDLAGDPGDFVGERGELVDHGVHSGLEFEDLAAGVDSDLLGQVAPGHGGCHRGDVADLVGQVG